jgi:hypothetical protein
MTGFLQRLAERAMGVSRPARAASAAPFAPLTEAVGEETAAEIRPGPESASAPSPVARGSATTVMRSIEPLTTGAQPSPSAPAAPTPSLVAELTTLKQMTAPPLIAPAPAAMPSPPSPGTEAAAARETVPEVRAARPDFAGLPASEVRLPRLPNEHVENAHPLQSAPPPLLASTSDSPSAFRVATPGGAATADRRTQAVEETTEVHVHIGRIEVTAVHEPAPAKPAAARRPAPMSLDEYLARRLGRPA